MSVRISSRCRYGLRAMLYLALRGSGRPVPLSEIAESEGIPVAFLERILAQLRQAGLVNARRGVAGGYSLGRPAAAVSAADIVTALEGPISLLDCVHDEAACARTDACLSRAVWCKLDEAVAGALEGVTLADLIEEAVVR